MRGVRALPAAVAALSFAAALSLATVVSARDLYVSPSGSDSNDGSSGAPWATLQHAADAVQPGDVVHVADGTYTGVYISTNGTASQPITFKAEGPNVVVNTKNATTDDDINIEGADYIIIDGFNVQDAPRIGIRIVEATGVIIRNNRVARSTLTGILTGWTPHIQILNNVSYGAVNEHGIYVSNSRVADDNPIIRGNESYGNGQNGVQVNGDCWEGGDGVISGAVIEDNFVHDNNWKGFSLISLQNSVIQNNVIYDNGLSAGAGGIHLADQPNCSLPSINNIVVNNTVVEPRITGIRITDGSVNNDLFNNLVVAKNSSYTIVDEVGGNNIDTVSNMTLTSDAGLFADAASNDYHLDASSAAIDAGVASYQGQSAPTVDRDGNPRPTGQGYDVGAYEAGASSPPPPPPTDTTPPSVSVTSPAQGQTVSGSVQVTASASDNVGVAGVTFEADGTAFAAEDTQSPYQASLTSTTLSNGSHTLTAVARDAAGNTTTSASVGITVSNTPSSGGILAQHPRLILNPQRLAEIRAAAGYDNNGNVIPSVTPSPQWVTFRDWIQTCYGSPSTCYNVPTWAYALYYMVTGDVNYANRAITNVQAAIDDGFDSERSNFYLHAHDAIQDAAVVFDWLYNVISPTQRAGIIDYMNRLVQEMYVQDPLNNPFYNAARWATNDPGNNYYYAQMLCVLMDGLATYGENDFTVPLNGSNVPLQLYFRQADRTYNDIMQFFYDKMEQEAMTTWISVRGEGGGWHEGTQYGVAAKNHIFDLYNYLKDAGGKDYFASTNFPHDAAYFFLYCNQPDNQVRYNGGDAGRDKNVPISPYERQLALQLADGLYPSVESQYLQYWANHIDPDMGTGWQHMYPIDLTLTNLSHPERDYSELPTAYYANGLGWMNSRSSWNTDAVSVTFICTDRVQSHQHKDQNSFVIFKGTGIDGWQAIDANFCPSSNGLTQGSDVHNTLLVNGDGQRYGDGTGHVVKHEFTPQYRYIVGDATDAYWTNPGGYSHGDQPYLQMFQRELVHVLPGYVIVYDRVTPQPNFAGVTIDYLLNFHNAPTVNGNVVTATSGGNKITETTLLPDSDFTISTASSMGCSRIQLHQNTPTTHRQFLNVLFTGTQSQTMPPVSLVRSQGNTMVGAQIDDPANKVVVMFSADPNGAPPQGGVIYNVGTLEGAHHYLFGLLPSCGYNVQVSRHDGHQTISVTPGKGWLTTDEGTLAFVVGDEPNGGVVASR